ncbi:major facilitator superfamily domain-containing protein [Armillaria borealis]|uniref:Major facilitator superfamily domain-containing protein n=1 Tax=Armillaria borealis TaxID=47425 RepID=A0AA39JD01_9AGAR|nr:major facilitator superfamily domain-containing protein [Armillaria borealis]
MSQLSGKKLYFWINAVAGLAIFFFGYDQGMMGGVNTSPHYVDTMNLGYSTYEGESEGYVVTITNPTRQGGIVSIYYLGTLIGCIIAGVTGDQLGRLKTMFIGCLWVMVGAALQCSAQNLAWMLCARVINGIGTGYLNAIVPVWSAEVATHTSRGAFIAVEFTLNIFGVVVAYWLEFGLGFVGDGRSEVRWRFPIAFQILPEAFEDEQLLEHVLGNWVRGSTHRSASSTEYLVTNIARMAGYGARKSQWLSGLNDVTYCLSTLFAIYTIDRWGRRIGLWWGAVGQGISIILAGVFSRLLKDHSDKAAQYGGAAAFFVFLYTAIFGATWLTIPWVYPTETFPLEVRAKGNAWGVVGWSIGNGWLMMLNPVMFNNIGEK